MARYCFPLRVRPDRMDEYRRRHAAVWPDMLQALADTGWRNYSLFLHDDGLLVAYVEADDLRASLAAMASRDVNARWQAEMAPFFAGLDGDAPDEGWSCWRRSSISRTSSGRGTRKSSSETIQRSIPTGSGAISPRPVDLRGKPHLRFRCAARAHPKRGPPMPGSSERDRQHEVMRLLEDAGRVSVPDLAERFGGSLVTVRKDLERLERRRLLRRVRGGAVPAPTPDEGAFEIRLHLHTAEKVAVARGAARMVKDGDAIAVDGSTTCYYLIKELRNRRGLVVVTNGLPAAEALAETDATVVMPGGTLRRSSWALVGDMGATLAGRGRLTYGFFGLRALSPELGLLDLSPEETAVKRRLVSISSSIYGLFDSSKVGRFALHPFVETSAITGLFCDDGVADEEVLAWKDAGVPVQRVPVERT